MGAPRKLGYGEGSIYREGDQWRAQITIDGKRYRRTRSTRREAVGELDKLKALAAAGLSAGDDTRLGDWLDWYMDSVVAKKHPNTIYSYQHAYDLLSPLRGKRLRELTPLHVEARMKQLDLSRNTFVRLKSCLGAALQEAVRRDMVNRNVARLAHIPAGAAGPKLKRALTRDEANALLAAATGERDEALCLVSLMCGLRPGEALGLPWTAIDLKSGTLDVVQALERHPKGEYKIGPPKVGSYRSLQLTPQVIRALKAHKARQRKERRAAPVWQESGMVFTTQIGTHLDYSNQRRSLRRLCEKADVEPISPNELRHSAATLLIEAGVPPHLVADMLGHTTNRMIEKHYRHKRGVVDVTSGQEQMLK